ncbi:MAG: hypothetical protein J6F31_08050 [Oscillospiraceae bacterium]|nr:hypothetical protein [Oscillospiraceae bacterium]
MGLLNMFGIDSERIIAAGCTAVGTVEEVRDCWWLGRTGSHAAADGYMGRDRFPHLVYFSYCVEGTRYDGCRYVPAEGRFPEAGEELTVYYDPESPGHYAVRV